MNIFFSDFSLTTTPPNPPINAVSAGQTATYTITVTPSNGFNQVVLLSCGTLPQGTTCTFNPPGVTLDNSVATTSTLSVATTTQTPKASLWRVGKRKEQGPGARGPWLLWVVAGSLVLTLFGTSLVTKGVWAGWKTRLRFHSALVVCAVLLSWLLLGLGCQTYYNGLSVTPAPVGTPTGNYTIVIIGTLGSNAQIVRPAFVNLAVAPG